MRCEPMAAAAAQPRIGRPELPEEPAAALSLGAAGAVRAGITAPQEEQAGLRVQGARGEPAAGGRRAEE